MGRNHRQAPAGFGTATPALSVGHGVGRRSWVVKGGNSCGAWSYVPLRDKSPPRLTLSVTVLRGPAELRGHLQLLLPAER